MSCLTACIDKDPGCSTHLLGFKSQPSGNIRPLPVSRSQQVTNCAAAKQFGTSMTRRSDLTHRQFNQVGLHLTEKTYCRDEHQHAVIIIISIHTSRKDQVPARYVQGQSAVSSQAYQRQLCTTKNALFLCSQRCSGMLLRRDVPP